MFWTGFICGVMAVLVIMAIIITVTLIVAYKGAPMAEDDE